MQRYGLSLCVLSIWSAAAPAQAQWPQWGGPNRDFATDAKGLADSWSSDGPRELWRRPLGRGNSAIIVDSGRLFTMYRSGNEEVVVALSADDGETMWERKYAAPIPRGVNAGMNRGPNATPIVAGDLLYTVGVAGHLQCLRKQEGEIVWSKDYLTDFKGKVPLYGFSSTPVVFKDRLIAAVGGVGCGVVAFDAKTGSVIWQRHDFGTEGMGLYASPIVVKVAGKEQVILMTETAVVGLDPDSGEIQWSYPHANEGGINVPTPQWSPKGLLCVSAGGNVGTRVLKFKKAAGRIKPIEVWSTRKMGVSIGNLVRSDDVIYGSSNKGMGPAFLTAVNLEDGSVLWSERGFGKANVVAADGKLIILDEDGHLALASPSPEALNVKSKVKLLKKPVWTVPTLVGRTLYMRDNEVIVALDLGPAGH